MCYICVSKREKRLYRHVRSLWFWSSGPGERPCDWLLMMLFIWPVSSQQSCLITAATTWALGSAPHCLHRDAVTHGSALDFICSLTTAVISLLWQNSRRKVSEEMSHSETSATESNYILYSFKSVSSQYEDLEFESWSDWRPEWQMSISYYKILNTDVSVWAGGSISLSLYEV